MFGVVSPDMRMVCIRALKMGGGLSIREASTGQYKDYDVATVSLGRLDDCINTLFTGGSRHVGFV